MNFITTVFLALLASTTALAAPVQLVEERAGAPAHFKIYAGTYINPVTHVLDVKDGNFANGTPIQLWQSYPGNPNQVFDLGQLPTVRPVGNTNLCLDAGVNPGDGSRIHLWQCYDGLPQQAWEQFYQDRFGRYLRLKGTNLCLDVPDGNRVNGQVLQVWTCGRYNLNQQFYPGSA